MNNNDQDGLEAVEELNLPKTQTQISIDALEGGDEEHAYGAPEGVTDKEVEQAVVKVNPDAGSMESRG